MSYWMLAAVGLAGRAGLSIRAFGTCFYTLHPYMIFVGVSALVLLDLRPLELRRRMHKNERRFIVPCPFKF